MNEQEIIERATAYVVQVEAAYLDDLVAKTRMGGSSLELQRWGFAVRQERERLNTAGVYDEEEIRILHLSQNG